MSDLREHEAALRAGLKRLEPHTAFAEVMAEAEAGESVGVDTKSTRTSRPALMSGAVFRAWAGDHWVEGAASSFDAPSINGAIDGIVALARSNGTSTPPPGESATTVGTHDARPARPMSDLGTEHLLKWANDARSWLQERPEIRVGQVRIDWDENERHYLNTAGANCYQRVFRAHVGIAAIASDAGRTQINFDGIGAIGGQEILDGIPEGRVRAVATDAIALLSAKAAPTGRMNVIFDPGVTATFAHESFGHGTEGDQFVRKRSYLLPLLGQRVGPDSLTLVDDGSIPNGWGSVYFDDEGHPGARTVLIDRGTFVSGLYDRESAAAMHARPTGNTRRASFLDRAFVRMTNTSVDPGDRTFEELVAEAGDGIVLERWESGMEDPAGGQMQIKVGRGHLIENGKITDLVGPMALSGKVLEVLKDIRGIGRRESFLMTPGF
ncbi:MAG TPA: TldD/PmbA family protein, partial [Thermoplasmata archaeon]|nr:TldD/PmbA family protein [Thermoplasmata archaeon]